MGGHVLTRGFEERDRERIVALLREYEAGIGVSLCFQNFEGELAGLPGDYAPPGGAMILAREPERRRAGRLRGGAAGAGLAWAVRDEAALSCARPARGSGLGRTLALAAIAEARRLGYARMCLDTLPSMTAAQALYRALGLSPDRRGRVRAARAAVRARAREPAMTGRVADQVLRLADGRALGFRVWGDPAGTPLLFLHGTPGSRLKFSIGHEAGRELGLAMVAPDRWGYGLSDAPRRAVAAGVRRRHGGADGSSGASRASPSAASRAAGPMRPAVAACLAARVTALALISPVGPIADAGCAASLSPLPPLLLHGAAAPARR